MKQQLNNIKSDKQEILTGSSKLSSINKNKFFDKNNYFLDNMHLNKAYLLYLENNSIIDSDLKILEKFKKRFKEYRKNWTQQPRNFYNNGLESFKKNINLSNPMCVDIEIASICDLGCPHCFREYVITPDKIMDEKLFYNIIDEISEMNVPSIKLNWRGEPLLHPKISEFIRYAKNKSILDVSINTNATTLTQKKSEELILSGLDQIIYSFDGGTKSTYEKMRPGRFKSNKFEKVYENIKLFNELRKKLNFRFPITKIQMVMTKDTRDEVDNFYNLFGEIVDDVTVTQYNERGGNLDDLSSLKRIELEEFLKNKKLPKNTPHIVNLEGETFISKERKPCEQLFQRLMVTYDGTVGMCCHDWGAQHAVGFINKTAFENDKVTDELEKKIINADKGFALLKNAKKPKKYNNPPKKISNLKKIWIGEELYSVRKKHFEKKIDDLEVCKHCSFKDTYSWEKI